MSDSEDRPAIPMEHGLRVDILDNEGIWNTGKIVDVSRDEEDMVEIKYDGWGDEYNEWIPLSSQRLAPLHMFTMVKKCWAKLTKWPWWPAFVVLRAPTRKSAADALNAESKIYVEFFDSYNEGKRSRCWMQKKNIASFQEGFDERASKNIGKNFPAYVDGTQRAMAGRSPVLFSGNGTLPIEFSSRYAKPLADAKLELAGGDEAKWFEAYRIFSAHYRVLYGYDFAKDADGSGKHAKGKHTNGNTSGDEDDDDEVEIIGSTGKPAKRGRGRPPKGKHPKKQPPPSYADEDGDEDDGTEEKEAADDDYEHAEEEEEEAEDDGADEEPESPRGRRSARTASKRKPAHEEEDEPRRNMRPRRAKEGDEGFSDDDDDEGEDFTHYEYRGDEHGEDDDQEMEIGSQHGHGESSSRSVSPERRQQPRTTTKFNAKVHKRTALTQLLNSTPPQPVLKKVKTSKAEPEKASRAQRAEISESMMKELEAAVTTSAAGQLHPKKVVSGQLATKSRRKPLHPQSLARSSAVPTSAVESTGPVTAAASAVAPSAIKPDPPSRSLHHWLGFGAADEGIPISGTARKPWSIQSWLISGFRRKQTSESLPTDD